MEIIMFAFFYAIGVFCYFIHTSTRVLQNSTRIAHKMDFDDSKLDHLASYYMGKTLFQTVIMAVFPLSFSLYLVINTRFSDYKIISSGLFTVIWLLFTGMIIKSMYYVLTQKNKALNVLSYDKYYQDKEFFWTMCPLLFGLFFSIYDFQVFLSILALVLGKYWWMDSLLLSSFSKDKLVRFWSRNKNNFLLLGIQACVMGYILFMNYHYIKGMVSLE